MSTQSNSSVKVYESIYRSASTNFGLKFVSTEHVIHYPIDYNSEIEKVEAFRSIKFVKLTEYEELRKDLERLVKVLLATGYFVDQDDIDIQKLAREIEKKNGIEI